jgi:predicted ATPase
MHYETQLEHIAAKLAEMQTRSRRMVWVRTGLFFTAAIGLFLGYAGVENASSLLLAGWLTAAGFMIAIVWHEHLRLKLDELTSHQNLFQRLLARLNRDWESLAPQALLPEFSDFAFTDDLDVGGHASLLQLLNLAGTLPGRRTLQSWLTQVPDWNVVTERQKAVLALRDKRSLRLSIIKTVTASSDGTEDVYGLPKWAGEPCWLPRHRVAHTLSWIGPALVIGGVITLILGLLNDSTMIANIGAMLLGTGFVFNLLVTIFWGSWIHDIFLRVTGQHRAVYQFSSVFRAFEHLPPDGGLLDGVRQVSTEGPKNAVAGFQKLLWVVRLANLQRDPLLYIVYLALQLAVMWDYRVLELLERWQVQYGSAVGGWFHALGRCEAIISGATLADEYPEWAFAGPAVASGSPLIAEQLGHPLLSDEARVPNDISITSDRPLVLVTGSNMAGKSTFMRAVGLNQLLVRTGSPVCATKMETNLYSLATSIRVRDSLKDGVSYFMAELKRLKQVVDLSHHSQATDVKVLFLLDEILQGTNSRERQIAVVTVLEKLLGFGAAGFISTHDLDLAAQPEILAVSQVVHFREYFETVDGLEQMRFDFKMRPGPTPTTNALKLLKMVGLDSQ